MRWLAPGLAVLLLTGCDSFGHIQRPPPMTAPGQLDGVPPMQSSAPPLAAAFSADAGLGSQGSLWRPGAKAFFRDPRARGLGDLLTVTVNLTEQAEFANSAALQRTTANQMGITNLFGLGTLLGHIIPGLNPAANPVINTSGNAQTNGQGDIKRNETMNLSVAATVLRVLPNGNLVIAGSQQIRLNNELRELQVRGIVRPEDILSDNTIPSTKIAEARISYGGRGVSSDLQRPTWGQDVLQRLSPF